MARLLLGLLAPMAFAAIARGESVSELLAAVAANARFPAPTRADVRITQEKDGGSPVTRAILLGRGRTLYLETEDGARALVRPRRAVVRQGARILRAGPGQPLAGTDLLLEDLAVPAPDPLRVPQISDDGPAGVVVIGAPSAPSAYVLLAFTIERARHAIVRTQYYRDTISDLVKLRRDGAFVEVADHWRPTEVTVEDLRERTSTRLALAWREAPDVPPTLFTPAGLTQPSGLAWP